MPAKPAMASPRPNRMKRNCLFERACFAAPPRHSLGAFRPGASRRKHDMDSVTQFLLGASVSGAVIGPKMGIRALLIGGVVATLPDLDAFVPMGNVIDTMTHHRGTVRRFQPGLQP